MTLSIVHPPAPPPDPVEPRDVVRVINALVGETLDVFAKAAGRQDPSGFIINYDVDGDLRLALQLTIVSDGEDNTIMFMGKQVWSTEGYEDASVPTNSKDEPLCTLYQYVLNQISTTLRGISVVTPSLESALQMSFMKTPKTPA